MARRAPKYKVGDRVILAANHRHCGDYGFPQSHFGAQAIITGHMWYRPYYEWCYEMEFLLDHKSETWSAYETMLTAAPPALKGARKLRCYLGPVVIKGSEPKDKATASNRVHRLLGQRCRILKKSTPSRVYFTMPDGRKGLLLDASTGGR